MSLEHADPRELRNLKHRFRSLASPSTTIEGQRSSEATPTIDGAIGPIEAMARPLHDSKHKDATILNSKHKDATILTKQTKITFHLSCQHCGVELSLAPSGRRKRFCSDACRQAAFRNEKAARYPSKGDQNRAVQPIERQYVFVTK